jgi:hypothetical protein
VWHGAAPTRTNAIERYLEEVGRPVTTSELVDHFRSAEPGLAICAVSSAVNKLASAKRIVNCGKVQEPRREGLKMSAYATPAVAQAYREGLTPPDPLAAPRAVVQTQPERAPEAPRSVAPRADASTPAVRLREAYSLSSLIQRLGPDVPSALERVAHLERSGRLECVRVDAGASVVWLHVEGGW